MLLGDFTTIVGVDGFLGGLAGVLWDNVIFVFNFSLGVFPGWTTLANSSASCVASSISSFESSEIIKDICPALTLWVFLKIK